MPKLCQQITVAATLLLSPIVAHAQTLTASWDPNPPADQITSYEVCIGTASRSCNFRQASVPASETTYVFTPNAGVLYYVSVRAVSAGGPGPYAPEITVSTPSLSQPANQSSTFNKAISPLSLSASDPDGDTLRFSHTGLPFGLTLNQSTGVITGTPTSTGTFNVTVFVSDDLVTRSRSFVWTVTSGSSDTTQPSLAITSHTSVQTVTTSSITLAGTASDSGLGNSGIASVTVNGAAATGGTATGSGTASWSRSVSLSAGANTLTVVATDGAGNRRTSTVSVTYATSIPPMTGASLSQNLASPQTTGTTITFTASGSGGVAPYEYQWFVQLNSGAPTMVRAWSTATGYAWTPTQAGTYVISIWARSAGTTTNAAQAAAQRTFLINAPTTSGTGVVARDTFTGSSGMSLTSHVPDVSPGSMWVQRQGATARLLSGRVKEVSTNVGYGLATLQAGTADGSVVVDVMSTGATPFGGIVFRALDVNRLLLLRYAGNASIGLIGLFRRVNGSFELIDQVTVAPIASGSTHRLGVQLSGSQVRATWDGSVVLTRTVTDYQTATQHGLLWHSDDPYAHFDNFVVTGSTTSTSPTPVNAPPVITGPANQSNTTGSVVSVSIVASDPEGAPLQYGASGLPAGVSVNTSTGLMSGTISASAGTYTVTTKASDGTSTATRSFTWTVTAPTTSPSPSPSGVVVRDTFTGAGTPLTAHRPDVSTTGGGWVQLQGLAAWMENGRVGEVASNSGYGMATVNAGASDGTVTVDMLSNGGAPFAGIVFRVVDANRGLLLRYAGNWTSGYVGLFRQVNGTYELIQQVTVAPAVPGTRHRLTVQLSGNQVRAMWDGAALFTRTVNEYQTATQHGLLWHSDDRYAYFDNFTVTSP